MSFNDLPDDENGNPLLEFEDILDTLNNQMMQEQTQVENDDTRGIHPNVYADIRVSALQDRDVKNKMIIDNIKDGDMNNVGSMRVQDFNQKYDTNLDDSDPSFIFKQDLKTQNYVNTIRQSNTSFSKEINKYNSPYSNNNILQQLQINKKTQQNQQTQPLGKTFAAETGGHGFL